MGDLARPGVQTALRRVREAGESLEAGEFVDVCLDALSLYDVTDATRQSLVNHAARDGTLEFAERGVADCSDGRVAEMLQLIVATREYQLA